MNGKSLDIKAEKLKKLKEIFPEIFTEEKVDWEKLEVVLKEDINFTNERYVLNWAGKSEAFRVLQTPTTATLVPVKEESVDFENTDNIFIEGENLEVLKVLQKAYFGKVKMIYIDPPYNTGNDHFIYPDRFSESREEYLKRIGDKDEEGYLLKEGLFRKNSKDSGHYHSNWLSMMYPRIFLARNLLRDDGVIFVSIDDNEVQNLRLLMNEIFGEENFIAQMIWNNEGHTDNQFHIKINHEYVLLYLKNEFKRDDAIGFVVDPNTRKESNLWKGYAENSITKNGPGNPFSEVVLSKGFPCKISKTLIPKSNLPNSFFKEIKSKKYISRDITRKYKIEYPIKFDDMVIKNGKLKNDCRVLSGWANVNKLKHFIDTDFSPIEEKDGRYSFYLSEKGVIYYKKEREKARNILSVLKNMGTTEQMRSFLEKIGIIFQYPKPCDLLKYLIKIGCEKDGIILDFFAGSCTTGHAVLELNKKESGKRRFICVQLPEKCDENSEAFKASYKTISEIGKERIRRVIKKIRTEQEDQGKLFKIAEENSDFGFKVFKLKPSNFKIWRSDGISNGEELEKQAEMFTDPVKLDSQEENILYELMLKLGHDLNSKIEKTESGVYIISDRALILVLSEISEKIINEIISIKPENVLCLDRLFEDNDQLKTNTILQMKDAGIEFKTI